MSPILELQRRLHESGRIRIGVTVPTGQGKTRPKKLETFRITSQDKRALDQVASLYGGAVTPWQDAPVGQQWEVITNTAEIRVAVPPERMALTQSYELWSGGGCQRRCDGERQQNDEPCFCVALDADDQRTPRCSRHTRVSVMLADLATTGLWRLDTQGFYASEELAGAFMVAQMISQQTGRTLLPGWLRLEQREIKRPGEPTKKFAVPVLDLEMNMAAVLGPGPAAHAVEPSQRPAIETAATEPQPTQQPTAVTPVPTEQPPSLVAELQRVESPSAKKPRRNAAAPIPDTGIKPRTAMQAAEQPPAAPAEPTTASEAGALPPVTKAQLTKLHTLFTKRGMGDHDDRLDWANSHLARTIVSSTELTGKEASRLIDQLEQEAAALAALHAQNPDIPDGSDQEA